MTGTEGGAAEHSRPIEDLFTGGVSALWATTYSLDLALFNEFLLPRLGEPPLNVVVLADHRRLATALERLDADAVGALAAVNRRWLLRGVRPGGQAFHPKTYLAVTGGRATLLVGSGNLSMDGLGRGREVFTTFRSGTAAGDAAIGLWRRWIRRVVGLVGDVMLAERLRDLEARLPAPSAQAPVAGAPLLHNLDESIAAQFAALVTAEAAAGVDELLLAAPYYDEDAEAVGRLLTDLQPRRVRVLLTNPTKVDGRRLAARLTTSGAAVEVASYEPDRFVHAKLIGAVTGARGWLLSGSANLSQAAVLRTVGDHGNIEVAVAAPLTADEVRAAFTPPETTIVPADLDRLTALSFRREPESTLPPVRLISATATADGTVQVTSDPPPEPGWLLDDLTSRQPLLPHPSGSTITAAPLTGRLVQLLDTNGNLLSNRVVVDDAAALAAVLTAATSRPEIDLPGELTSGDLDTPLGRALAWVHQNLVMDVTERTTATSSSGVTADEADQQSDDDLWARLEREQLARDPRATRYRTGWAGTAPGGTDKFLELLDTLRARTPAEPATRRIGDSLLAHLLDQADEDPDSEDEESTPRRWQRAARIRVRARNLLRRWAAVQTDPRLAWVDPMAPADNFANIAAMFAQLRLDYAHEDQPAELTADDLDELWLRWLRGFAGTGTGDGWLDQLNEADHRTALQRHSGSLPEIVAALCWLTIHPGRAHRERVVAAQSIIIAALDHGLLDPNDHTARYLSRIVGHRLTRTEVEEDLLNAATFIDDALWCARTATELTLDDLKLQAPPGAATIQVRLDVRGIGDPLLDPRLPRLLTATRRYRRCRGVAVYAADSDWRLSLDTGETIAFLPGHGQQVIESVEPVNDRLLNRLTASAGVLADLFPRHFGPSSPNDTP